MGCMALGLATLALGGAPAGAQPLPSSSAPDALDALRAVRGAYAALDTYADSGVVEWLGGDGSSAVDRRVAFETFHAKDRSFGLRLSEERAAVTGRDEIVLRFDAEGGRRFAGSSVDAVSVDSLRAELRSLLGPLGTYALAHAVFLQSGLDLFSEPRAAVDEGQEECDGGRCRILTSTLVDSSLEIESWIDVETGLFRRLLVHSADVGSTLRQALTDAGVAPRGGGAVRETTADSRTLRVVFSETWIEPGVDRLAELASRAPATPTVPTSDVPPRSESAVSDEEPVDRQFSEEIDVTLGTAVARVVDSGGRAIVDLGPEDFEVRSGRRDLEIVDVHWVGVSDVERLTIEEMRAFAEAGVTVPAPGRFVVFFVQADLHPVRARGQQQLLPEAERLLGALHPDDRIAVLSFRSHLDLRLDFTGSRDEVLVALEAAVTLRRPPDLEPRRYPSLARHLDPREAARAATPERALELVGLALDPFPGRKILLYAGWGLGRYGAGGVRMTAEYEPARAALQRAGVEAFVLDITQADHHSLEVGLELIARDTGGTYEKTFPSPGVAVERIARALSGHYEISFRLPPGDDDPGRLIIRTRRGDIFYERRTLGGRKR